MKPATIEMERAHTLEFFERARTNGWQKVRSGATPSPTTTRKLKAVFEERFLGPFWRVACAEQDELFYLETMQQVLEALRSGSQHQSWTRLSVELAKTRSTFWRQSSRVTASSW